MIIESFYVQGLAHLSYLVCSGDVCMVIDPERRIDGYLQAAEELGGKITHILETHLHADFCSGHLDLALATGARIYAPRAARCKYDHVPVAEGDVIEVGKMLIQVRETPGHTPEHVSYVVMDATRSKQDPAVVFTGDTLFIGDVGRPDIFPDRERELSQLLFESLNDKLLSLPDYVEVYPAHGAGSLCGRSMAARRSSSIGYERRHSPELQHETSQEMARSLLTNMPPTPEYFVRCTEQNREGPEVVANLEQPRPLSPPESRHLVENGAMVIDLRPFESYCGAHVPRALCLDLRGNAPTFGGWLIPPDRKLLLVAESKDQINQGIWTLRRVGLDSIVGWIKGGITAWAAAGYDIGHTGLVSADGLFELVTGTRAINLVDVRAATEFEGGAIQGAQNIPVEELRTRHIELDHELLTVTICRTGARAAMGASLLERAGLDRVWAVAGGMAGYAEAGHAQKCEVCAVPHGPRHGSWD